MPQEPTPDDRAGSPNAAPAVNVNWPFFFQGLIDGIEDECHFLSRGNGQINDGKPHESCCRGILHDQFVVSPKRAAFMVDLVLMHQVDKGTDTGIHHRSDFLLMLG